MKYTVEHGHEAVDNVVYYPDLTRQQATALAIKLAATGKRQVYVAWNRQSDGQHGYLNRNSDHAITGAAW